MKFWILASLFAFSAANASQKTVELRSSFDVPGYNEITADGLKTGFEIELAEAVFASQGYAVNWTVTSWDDIVADLKNASLDKNYIYVASIEGRDERKEKWLFGGAVEFDASHYFFGKAGLKTKSATVIDTESGKSIPNFIADVRENRVNGRPLRIATWKGSAFEIELRRVFPSAKNIEIVAMDSGNPVKWLNEGAADLVYVFASGPKNDYTSAGFKTYGGPVANFDIDRFGGTSPALPMNKYGQEMGRVWNDGFAAILRDDTFFKISMKYFGRVSFAEEFNAFLIQDLPAFKARIRAFEKSCEKDLVH